MNGRLLTLSASALVCASWGVAAWADLAEAWVRRYNNDTTDYADYGEAVAIGADGAVYVAGLSFYEVDPGYFVPRFLTIRYEPDGTQSWVRDFTTHPFSAAAAWRVEVDSKDDVVVTGGVNGHADWGVVKYSSAGSVHWSDVIAIDSPYLTEPDELVIDDAGNVYLTGDVGSFTGPDSAPVIKYSSTGQLLVNKRYVGPWGLGAYGSAIGTDSEGNIIIAGTTVMPNVASELFVAKYSPTGTLLWDRTYGLSSPVSHDGARDMLIEADGSIVVVGYLGSNTSNGIDIVLRKYTSDGGVAWSTTWGNAGRHDVAYRVLRDAEGGYIIAGYQRMTSGGNDVLVARFDSAGNFDWSGNYAGAGLGSDAAFDVAIADDGGIVVAGVSQPFANVDFALAAEFDPEDGSVVSAREYGGPADGDAWHAAVALNADGDAFVTGSSFDFSTDYDVHLLRYDRASDLFDATLTDVAVNYGQHIGGTLAELVTSDNFYYRVRSRFGFTSAEPNVIDMIVGATTTAGAPGTITLSMEGRLSQNGGTGKLRLRNWSTGLFQQVYQYPIGASEAMVQAASIPAANRVRASDGRIELSVRQSVIVVFSSAGFDSFTDYVGIQVGQ